MKNDKSVVSIYINKRRIELGYSLQRVGNAMGVYRSTVLRWEQGNVNGLRKRDLDALAKVLCVPDASYFFGSNKEAEDVKIVNKRDEIVKLLEKVSDIDKLDNIYKVIETLIKLK